MINEMGTEAEIRDLEERLRQAELAPDPHFFEAALADDVILVGQDGTPAHAKARVVAAHRPGGGPKFTKVETRDLQIVDQGTAAVVTCTSIFEAPSGTFPLKMMRVWLKRDGRWQIIVASVANG